MAERFAADGHEVLCLKGTGATVPDSQGGVRTERFGTNDDLWACLSGMAANRSVEAVFHAAALCDYRVKRIEDGEGRALQAGKLASRDGDLCLRLEPARKILPELRGLFPRAWIVGWKYEVDGGRSQALARGWEQLGACGTDAVVVNGPAIGPGFVVCEAPGVETGYASRPELAEGLARALAKVRSGARSAGP